MNRRFINIEKIILWVSFSSFLFIVAANSVILLGIGAVISFISIFPILFSHTDKSQYRKYLNPFGITLGLIVSSCFSINFYKTISVMLKSSSKFGNMNFTLFLILFVFIAALLSGLFLSLAFGVLQKNIIGNKTFRALIKSIKEQFSIKFLMLSVLKIVVSCFVGIAMLSVIFMIPSNSVKKHMIPTAKIMENEGVYHSIYSWCSSSLDNYTDSIMLMNAATDADDTILNKVAYVYRDTVNGAPAFNSLVDIYGDNAESNLQQTYSRYWHGYLLYVKPIMLITDYGGLRVINAIIQTILIIIIVVLLIKSNKKELIIPYLVSNLMLMPIVLFKSLQFSSCFYVFTVSSIAIICYYRNNKLDEKKYSVFLFSGIATAYFDFLTYPISTFGIPIIFYLSICNENIQKKLCVLIKSFFTWIMGYVGMWASKWIFAGIMTKGATIKEVTGKLEERSSGVVGDNVVNVRDCLTSHLMNFLKTPVSIFLLIFIGICVVSALLSICQKHSRVSITQIFCEALPFAAAAYTPILWYTVTLNHSVIHINLTSKACVVIAFAVLCFGTTLRRLIKAQLKQYNVENLKDIKTTNK